MGIRSQNEAQVINVHYDLIASDLITGVSVASDPAMDERLPGTSVTWTLYRVSFRSLQGLGIQGTDAIPAFQAEVGAGDVKGGHEIFQAIVFDRVSPDLGRHPAFQLP